MSDLKPCPFCGGPVHFCGTPQSDECNGCHQIKCDACVAYFDLGYGPADPDNSCESVEELRAKIVPYWNKRADDALLLDNERLAGALVKLEDYIKRHDYEMGIVEMLDIIEAALAAHRGRG